MAVVDTIRSRRTIYDFKPEAVPRDKIAQALEHAVWAPNHKVTEPWRFIVVNGKTKENLAGIYRLMQMEKTKSDDPDVLAKAGRKGYEKLMSKPTIIGVVCRKDADPVRAREDYAAACCAMYNISLAAWEEGIGMQWSTSALIRHPETLKLLQVNPEEEEIIGFLYTGYPAAIPEQRRVPAKDRTTWFD